MDRFREMEAFVAVAEAGSFARAAARLRVSPPAVTRAVASLEDRLGVRLLNRTTRRVSLTEAGSRFLHSSRRLLDEVGQAEHEAAGELALPAGHLTVTAPVTFGRLVVGPVVGGFLDAYQRVTASLTLLDRVVGLADEGIDVAIRIGDLPDSSLIARRVGEVRRVLVASPTYLARYGAPASPADLQRRRIIAFSGLMGSREWRYLDGGRMRQIALAPRLEINDAAAALAAAEAGDGITMALSYMVAEKVRSGRLRLVLDAFAPPSVPVHLLHRYSRLVPNRVRAFVDFAAPRLRDALDGLAVERPAGAAVPN